MVTKPQYSRVLTSRKFNNRADAEGFAKDMKVQYKEADLSLKHDIRRTPEGMWEAVVYVKV